MTERLHWLAHELGRIAAVPTATLVAAVVHEGACITALTRGEPPTPSGDRAADRDLSARVCSGCPRQWECVELDLRWSGPDQRGTFGPLPDEDRRALFPVWRARRGRGRGRR